MPKIVVAGASGFIGRALIPVLLEKFPDAEITALSRNAQESQDSRIVWKACDLFSLKSIEEALPSQIDLAFYLVHSMGPTAALDQGSFADYDLILADNFARSLKKLSPKQLVYLGGLMPDKAELSLHLQSRREVEEIFAEHELPLTILRAGLIMGDAGSSSQILIKLVRRLPVMLCPKWTQTATTPVDLDTVLGALTECALKKEFSGRTFDLAGCQPITYLEMMRQTARTMGLRRLFIKVPFFSPAISRLWVSLFTNSSRELVYPLVESLEHAMVADPSRLYPGAPASRSYGEMLASLCLKSRKAGRAFLQFRAQRRTVRSIQRLTLPPTRDAMWIKDLYIAWLPRFLAPLIQVDNSDGKVVFSLFVRRFRMLELEVNRERSDSGRQLLNITGGLLVHSENRGRLEFRTVLKGRYVLAAIHDFKPSLPWLVYRWTQAQIHLLVMSAFARRLRV